MKLVFKIILILFPAMVFAKPPDSQVSKTINQSYYMTKGGSLDVINKYGQVVITSWDKDTVSFKIDITAFGKNRSDARKFLERVQIDFDKTSQYITAETIFDKNSNFFVELWKSFTDEATALLSKSKIEINYEIKIPKGMMVNLENRFGDVYLNEMDGKMNLVVMHGNLRSNNLNANSNIDMSFGDIRIKYLHSGRLTLKAADGDIIKTGNITLNSSSSDVVIREADRIRLDSRSDKRLKIDKIHSLNGKTLFSNVIIGELENSLELDLSYGEVSVRKVSYTFSNIDLSAKSADIDLSLSTKSFMTVDIEGKEENMFLPLSFENLPKKFSESKKLTLLSGKIGKKNNYPALLTIRSSGGEITISQDQAEETTVNTPQN